jgi:hypothetical protein
VAPRGASGLEANATSKTALISLTHLLQRKEMNQMDPTLAQIYGTNQPEGEELEKTAAAELAEELADDDQIDLDSLTEEDLEAAANEVLEGAAGEEGEEVEEPEESEGAEKTAGEEGEDEQEKVAEADYMGRVMAHAMVQELRGIEKQAKKGGKKGKGGFFARVKGGASKASGKVERFGRKAEDKAVAGAKYVGGKAKSVGKKVSGSKFGKAVSRGAGKVSAHLKRHRGKYGLGAAAVGVGAGAYGAKKAFEKKASAMDTLVQQRALEILAEAGIEVEDQTEKTAATKYDVLAQVVEERAAQLLADNGYEVELVEEPEEDEESEQAEE